jgi:hypothetical protein
MATISRVPQDERQVSAVARIRACELTRIRTAVLDPRHSKLTEKQPNVTFSFRNLTLGGARMVRKPVVILGLAGILMSLGAVLAVSEGSAVPFPTSFRNWFAVNSMIVTKDSPMFAQIGGMHVIYVNAEGIADAKEERAVSVSRRNRFRG